MATFFVNPDYPFVLDEIDLNFFAEYTTSADTIKNVNENIFGVSYVDRTFVSASLGNENRQLNFYGSNFTGTPLTGFSAGLVGFVSESDLTTSNRIWYLSGIELSLSSIYNAALTLSNADEIALFESALSGNDMITLSNLADKVSGFSGDDIISGLGGDDLISGGTGLDTVVFTGPRLQYDISRVGDTVTVAHRQAGGDGTDTLTGVERLQFADGFMGLVPEELVLFLPGTRDLITWDSTQGSNGFTYFFRLNATTNVAAVADLTGDGRADLLLSQPGGGLVRWDPSLGGNGFSVLPAAPGFDVAAIGDITGNGADDILLKNANGQLRMLDPVLGTVNDLFALAPGWSLKGVANINGSGKDDIILQNNTSGAVIAYTDEGWRDLITLAPGSGWEIAGLGDVVGGLADDFIFRNSNNGVTIFWDTTDSAGGFHDFATIGQGWNLTKVSDLSGDGRDDVVYQNINGLAIYWSGTSWVDLGSTLIGAEMMGTGLFI